MILFYCLGVGTFLLGLFVGVGLSVSKNRDLEDSVKDQAMRITNIENAIRSLVEIINDNAETLNATTERLQAWIEIQRAELPVDWKSL
jgi:prefoldin subunit 5